MKYLLYFGTTTIVVVVCSFIFKPQKTKMSVGGDVLSGVDVLGSVPLEFEEIPLGQTERVVQISENILDFDDYIQRCYLNVEGNITVYIAYWKSEDINMRATTSHNPDECWVKSAGWSEQSRAENVGITISEQVGGEIISPIEFRFLKAPHSSEYFYTYFWQTWGGEVAPIRKKSENDVFERIKRLDYWKIWEVKKKPLYFVRIHSKVPLAPIVSVEPEERNAVDEFFGVDAQSLALTASRSKDIKYLVDYPEVKELLLAIQELTTAQIEMVNGI